MFRSPPTRLTREVRLKTSRWDPLWSDHSGGPKGRSRTDLVGGGLGTRLVDGRPTQVPTQGEYRRTPGPTSRPLSTRRPGSPSSSPLLRPSPTSPRGSVAPRGLGHESPDAPVRPASTRWVWESLTLLIQTPTQATRRSGSGSGTPGRKTWTSRQSFSGRLRCRTLNNFCPRRARDGVDRVLEVAVSPVNETTTTQVVPPSTSSADIPVPSGVGWREGPRQ